MKWKGRFEPDCESLKSEPLNPRVHLSANGWKNKVCYIHTVEYYSAFKGNEILIHTAIWINIEDIMLNEITQSQKNKYCIIPHVSSVVKFIETASRMVDFRGWA